MRILPCHQGTPEWHKARAKHYRTASRAPVVMRESRYQSYSELLYEIYTGISREINAATQAVFDVGHAVEEPARKIVEGYLKFPLLPLTCLTDDEYLLASFDGVNEEHRVGWECKQWNEALAEMVRAKSLSPYYFWQLEAQAAVGNLDYTIFTCSNGTPEKSVHMKYVPVPGRREQLLAAWRQFDADLAAYTPPEVIPAAVATPTMALPALSIQVNGSISLTDNLAVFGEKLTAFIERVPTKPSTDQEFADCEAAVKVLETAQGALEAAESSALAQTATIDQMRRTVALYVDQARSTRLMLEKLVKARKEQIRVEIVQEGRNAFNAHISMLNRRLGKLYMPMVMPDFGAVIKGKKTVASLRDAVDTELARCKIDANAIADRIQINLMQFHELAPNHSFLFADTAQIVLKEPDDLTAIIKTRIAEHQAAEQKRLDAERERIRQEEQAKAERDARERSEKAAAAQAMAGHQEGEPTRPVDSQLPAPAAAPSIAAEHGVTEDALGRQQTQSMSSAATPSRMVTTDTVIAAPPSKDGYGIVGAIPPIDREALILSFMASEGFAVPRNRAQTVHLLRDFFKFCDKFKVKSL